MSRIVRCSQLLLALSAVTLPAVARSQAVPVRPTRAPAAAPVLAPRIGVADSVAALGLRLRRVPKLKSVDRRAAEARVMGAPPVDSVSVRTTAPDPTRVPPPVRPAAKRNPPSPSGY